MKHTSVTMTSHPTEERQGDEMKAGENDVIVGRSIERGGCSRKSFTILFTPNHFKRLSIIIGYGNVCEKK